MNILWAIKVFFLTARLQEGSLNKVDTTNETVAGLEVGTSVNDTIALTSVDGTMANLVIRVSALTQVAEIRNTINGDTGELRLDLDPHQREGRLSFSFLKTDALADDGNQKDAYVTLYGSSGSSSSASGPPRRSS